MKQEKLNLGCGTDIRKGYVNLDSKKIKGVDVVHDIGKFPWPFKNNQCTEIVCQDILEHVEYVPVLKEIHRILQKGGKVYIKSPHFTSRNNFTDPTHKRMFGIRTLEFFIKNGPFERDYYFDFHFSKIESKRITFEKGILFYNYLVEPIINLHPKIQSLFEATFLSRLFPAEDIKVVMIK